jgi:hypothetical protein
VCLTSYRSPYGANDLLDSTKIWEACRATSAASSFFDGIAIGRYQEEFVTGATGANNPVWELWNQAQLIWGLEPLQDNVRCLVSVGTGIPSLKPFRDDVSTSAKLLSRFQPKLSRLRSGSRETNHTWTIAAGTTGSMSLTDWKRLASKIQRRARRLLQLRAATSDLRMCLRSCRRVGII